MDQPGDWQVSSIVPSGCFCWRTSLLLLLLLLLHVSGPQLILSITHVCSAYFGSTRSAEKLHDLFLFTDLKLVRSTSRMSRAALCSSSGIIQEKTRPRDACSLNPTEERVPADRVCLEGNSLLGCWTTMAVAGLFCYCGKSGAEPVTCHLFFECNQLFFHGPFGVTMNDGSG